MKAKGPFSKIYILESLLKHFSFGELTMEEASDLKRAFEGFKSSMDGSMPLSIGDNGGEDLSLSKGRQELLTALEYILQLAIGLREGGISQIKQTEINDITKQIGSLIKKTEDGFRTDEIVSQEVREKIVTFNLQHMLRNVKFVCDTLIVNEGMEVVVDLDTQIPEVLEGNPSKISRILLNVLGHAIKNLQVGKLYVRVSLLAQTQKISSLEFQFVLPKVGKSPYLDYGPIIRRIKSIDRQIEIEDQMERKGMLRFLLPYGNVETTTAKIERKQPSRISLENQNVRSLDVIPLLDECRGDVEVWGKRMEKYQQQLLTFVGKVKIKLGNQDYKGLEKDCVQARIDLDGLQGNDLISIIDRIERTCITDRDEKHLQFLYQSFLEECGHIKKRITEEMARYK